MKGFFLKDSSLKVISFVVAVLLWFYVILVVDPSVDVTVKDIPIRYTNQEVLEERGLSLVPDANDTVELKIRGSRKKIANIENKNIYASVDLMNMTKVGKFKLPISISVPYEYDEIVSKTPNNVDVVIDKIVTVARGVEIKTEGSVANGYIAGTPQSSVTSVTLKGASSLIEKIRGVAAVLDYDGRTGDINDKEKLFFVDGNGKIIDEKDSIYESVSMDVNKTDIKCSVMRLETIPVRVDTSMVGDEYKITVQPSNVTVYAEDEIMAELLEISTEPVDAEKLSAEGKQNVKLVVPEGVFLRDGISEVMVKAEKKE